MDFYVGTHRPAHMQRFRRCMVSVNVLQGRRKAIEPQHWIMDSGAFTRVLSGRGHLDPDEYAREIDRWQGYGCLDAVVAQDYMCEPFMLDATGATVPEHQAWTIARYDALVACDPGPYLMPVLQGYAPSEYTAHVEQYGERLREGAWVGVGSLCRRNRSPIAVEQVLEAIRAVRPDLRLHGFGLKITALRRPRVYAALASCDSMAWSYAARRQGRDANHWSTALAYARRVDELPVQLMLAM